MGVAYNATVDLIERHLVGGQERVAVVDDRGATTYGELSRLCNRAGNLLSSSASSPSSVLLVMHDSVELVALLQGAIKAGIASGAGQHPHDGRRLRLSVR